jgi:hypothetical protein
MAECSKDIRLINKLEIKCFQYMCRALFWPFGTVKDVHDVNSQDVWFDVSVLEGFRECWM